MIGQHIGNYQVIRRIGGGGMGQVFEALHLQIGRRAAIKVLHPHYVRDPEAAARFLNEARAVNLVQHQGLVGVFEHGQLPDGTPYIIMEHLQGVSLARRLREAGGPLGLQAVRLTRQMASALAAAHGQGVIHRDLKPANVMLVPDPDAVGGERVKILDFGIAKLATTAGRSEEGITRSGMMMGTPSYASPEQCRNAASVDDKSDVYSLGVMLYEMLAGRRPFSDESDMDLMVKHVSEPPPPLLQVAPVGTVSAALAALVHAMLAKAPAERPSMTQVMVMLDSAQRSGALPVVPVQRAQAQTQLIGTIAPQEPARSREPVHESTLGRSSGQSQFRRQRSRLLPAAAVGVLVALGGLGAAGLWLRQGETTVAVVRIPARQVPALPAQQQPPRQVHWSVLSRPAGAQVIRVADGAVLGRTPWVADKPAGDAGEDLVLRHRGYFDRQVHLSRTEDQSQSVNLTPLPRQARPLVGNTDVPRLD